MRLLLQPGITSARVSREMGRLFGPSVTMCAIKSKAQQVGLLVNL